MKHMKLLGMLLGGFAAAGIAGTAHASPQGVSKNEIVFGINTALSGPASPWGVGSVEGIRMRFDEINEAGGIHGRKLKLIAEDHQYQVPKAVQAANKLINRDKIFAMVGALGTPMNNAVMPKLFEKNLPNLFPYTAARSMVEPQHPLKFLALSTYYDQGRIGTKYAVETLGKKAICRMTQDSDFGQETVDATDAQIKAMGMTLVAETKHRPDDTDFVAPIAKLRGAGCDAVILGTILKDTIIINATAKKMGWNVPFIGNIAAYDQIIAAQKGGITEGFYAVTTFNIAYEDQVKDTAKAWFQRYKEKFGKEPGSAAQNGYITADLVAIALQRAGRDITMEKFLNGITSIEAYSDIFEGPIRSFGPNKHKALEKSVVAQIQNGRWVPLTGAIQY